MAPTAWQDSVQINTCTCMVTAWQHLPCDLDPQHNYYWSMSWLNYYDLVPETKDRLYKWFFEAFHHICLQCIPNLQLAFCWFIIWTSAFSFWSTLFNSTSNILTETKVRITLYNNIYTCSLGHLINDLILKTKKFITLWTALQCKTQHREVPLKSYLMKKIK